MSECIERSVEPCKVRAMSWIQLGGPVPFPSSYMAVSGVVVRARILLAVGQFIREFTSKSMVGYLKFLDQSNSIHQPVLQL